MKKFLSLTLAIVMLLFLVVPGFASFEEDKEYDDFPVVIVRGIDFGGLYLEDGAPAIGVDFLDIVAFIQELFYQRIVVKNDDAFIDSSLGLVSDIFENVAMDKNGNSKTNIHYKKYEKSVDNYMDELSLVKKTGEIGLLKTVADKIGGENVFYFTYDWRKSAKELAGELKAYIDNVIAQTNKSKVNIAAVSMGGMVTSAYLYYYGDEAVNNLVFVSSAHNGTYGPGDAFNGKIHIDGHVLYNQIRKSFSGSLIKSFLLGIIEKIGVFDAISSLANKIIEDNPQALNNDVLREGFGTLLGLWALCPDDKFESGVEFLYGGYESQYPILIEKLEETGEFLHSTEKILEAATENGVKVSFVSNYNTPLSPYYENAYLQGDGVLETVLTSNFAAVAPYGEILSDEMTGGENNSYLSPDGIINAQEALYKDMTWFVKDAPHVATEYASDYASFIVWLLLSENQPTIFTSETYPQFMRLDENDKLVSLK